MSSPNALRAEIVAKIGEYYDAAFAPKPFVPGESPIRVSGRVFDAAELGLLSEASLVGFLADRTALKRGLVSPGMHIPVVPSERVLEEQSDYLLILAWTFGDEIMRQQAEYRRRGGKFILPIPEPVIVP